MPVSIKQELTHEGRTQSLEDWARELGFAPSTLAQKVRRLGAPEALSTPALSPAEAARRNRSKSPWRRHRHCA